MTDYCIVIDLTITFIMRIVIILVNIYWVYLLFLWWELADFHQIDREVAEIDSKDYRPRRLPQTDNIELEP